MSTDARDILGTQPVLTAEVVELPLEQLIFPPDLNPRRGDLDADNVRLLEELGGNWEPIDVLRTPEGYAVANGRHRAAAAANLGLSTISARIIELPADADYRIIGFGLSAKGNLPLSLDDRRAFANYLLLEYTDWSDRKIAEMAGLSQPTVAKIRGELEASARIEQTETRVGRGGYKYAVTRQERRPPGELPPDQEPLGERLFTPRERRAQAKLARYFLRLADALDDQFDLAGWELVTDAAEACRLVLGEEAARELAERIGPAARNVLDMARALGCQDDPA